MKEDGPRPSLALICALPRELRGFGKTLTKEGPARVPAGASFTGRLADRAVTVLSTGVGQQRALEATRSLLRSPARPGAVLAFGFGGALDPDLRPGDLVLGERILTESVEIAPHASAPELLQQAAKLAATTRRLVMGTIITLDATVLRATEKRQLGLQTGAQIADMETMGVARAAAEEAVPTLCVRAVVDAANEDLPPGVDAFLDRSGRIRLLQIAAAILLRPWGVASLARLGRRSRTASASIARFVTAFATRAREID